MPILTRVYSPLNELTLTMLTPKTHFAQFYFKVTFYFFSPWAKISDTGDEAVMKIHKKTKIGITEIGTFSTITSNV